MQSGFGAWFHEHPAVGVVVALAGPTILTFAAIMLLGLAKPKRRAAR